MPSLLVSTEKPVRVIAPSPDVSPLSITLPVLGVSSGVETASLLSVKVSFTGVIVSVKVDVSVPP